MKAVDFFVEIRLEKAVAAKLLEPRIVPVYVRDDIKNIAKGIVDFLKSL